MRRILKNLLFSVLGILLLALGVAWWFIEDEEWFAGRAEQFVSDLTGRQFSIGGTLVLHLSLHPAVEVNDLSLSNVPWASEPDMATIKHLAASIDLMSLLSDRLVIHYIEADGVTVALAENENGEINWDLLPEQNSDEGQPTRPSTQLPFILERFELAEFTMTHDVPGREEPLDLWIESLILNQDGDGPMDAVASGRIGGLPLSLDGRIDPLGAVLTGGPMVQELNLQLGDITLESSGSIQDVLELRGFELKFHLSGPNFEWITRQAALPEFSSGPFDFSLVLDSDEAGTQIGLNGDLGTLNVLADGQLDHLLDPEKGGLNFEISGPDLQALGEAFGEKNLVAAPYRFNGDLSVSGDRTVIHEIAGEVGENSGELSGVIGEWPALEKTELEVHIQGPDFSQWGSAMRINGLRENPFEFTGRISNRESGVFLTTSELLVGDHQIAVTGSLGSLPDFLGTDLMVDFMTADISDIAILPGYGELPHQPVTVKGGIGWNSSGILLNDMRLDMDGHHLILDGTLTLEENLLGSELRTQLSTPSLGNLYKMFSFEGLPDRPLDLAGTYHWSDGGFDFDVHDVSFGSISMKISGNTPKLDSINGLAADFSISMPSLRAAAFLLDGKELPDLPITSVGRLRYVDQVIGLQKIEGTLGETAFQMDASVMNYPQLDGSKIRFSISGADFHPLINYAVLESLTGDFGISGEIFRTQDLFRIDDLTIDLGTMHAELAGTVDELPGLSSMDMTVSFNGPDFSKLAGVLEQPLPELDFSVNARVNATDRVLKLYELNARLGSSDISGQMSISLPDGKELSGRLRSNLLDLGWLADELEGVSEPVGIDSETQSSRRVFPDKPIQIRQLDESVLDLGMSVGHLNFGRTRFENIRISLFENDNILSIDPFEFEGLYGGGIKGKLKADRSSGTERFALDLEASGLRLGLAAVEDQDPETIAPIDVLASLSGGGETYRQLAASLKGRIRAVQGSGKIAHSGLEFFLSNLFFELFNMLNPFAGKSEFTNLDCGVLALNIEDGIVTTVAPFVWQTEQVTIISGGKVDLGSEKLDMGFNTKVRKGIGISTGMVVNPFIKLGGTLSSPTIELDPTGTAVSGSIAVATAGLSLIGKSLWDRFFSTSDPCGKTLEQIEKLDAEERQS